MFDLDEWDKTKVEHQELFVLLMHENEKDIGPDVFNNIPSKGWVSEMGIALLMQTDWDTAQIEPFVLSKHLEENKRSEMIECLAKACEWTARELGYKKIGGYSPHKRIIKVARSLDYVIETDAYTYMWKGL